MGSKSEREARARIAGYMQEQIRAAVNQRDELRAQLTAAQERIAELEAWAQESRVAHMKADEARLQAECRLQRIVEAGDALADAAWKSTFSDDREYVNAFLSAHHAYREAVGDTTTEGK